MVGEGGLELFVGVAIKPERWEEEPPRGVVRAVRAEGRREVGTRPNAEERAFFIIELCLRP